MMLNSGIDPVTNKTIIPRLAFEEVTTAHSLVDGRSSQPYFSLKGYCMGWGRKSYQGHEVCSRSRRHSVMQNTKSVSQIVEHAGGIVGISAEVVLAPSDGLGIVALANADEKHAQEFAVIYRIIEDYVGLERKESERIIASLGLGHEPQTRSTTPTDPSPQTPLTLPLTSYAGEYYDPGYGTYVLCAPTTHPSPPCTDVLAAWAPFENVSDPASPTLYAAISSPWYSHIRLAHQHGDTFGVNGIWPFPHGYGRDQSPFVVGDLGNTPITGEFWVREGRVVGFAMNGFVGELTEQQRLGGTVAETAEVWFNRV